MGIKGFYQFLHKNFSDCITTITLKNIPQDIYEIDHLYFDINHLLYEVSPSKNDEVFLIKFYDLLESILKNFQISKTIFLAVDGPSKIKKNF